MYVIRRGGARKATGLEGGVHKVLPVSVFAVKVSSQARPQRQLYRLIAQFLNPENLADYSF